MSETEKQELPQTKAYQYWMNEWRQTMVALNKERRRIGSNRAIVKQLEADKATAERHMRALSGHDPDNENDPSF